MSGVTISWLAAASGTSRSTVERAKRATSAGSKTAATEDFSITTGTAVEMALVRPRRGMLPYWSRLAIAELSAQGMTYAALMTMFGVSRSTVYRAKKGKPRGFAPLSGRRLLTPQQTRPVCPTD